jgi:Mn2+/Fe2+ NRAMP family transporter
MILLINNKKIMGTYVNNSVQNIIGWGAVIILTGLSLMLLVMPMLAKLK